MNFENPNFPLAGVEFVARGIDEDLPVLPGLYVIGKIENNERNEGYLYCGEAENVEMGLNSSGLIQKAKNEGAVWLGFHGDDSKESRQSKLQGIRGATAWPSSMLQNS